MAYSSSINFAWKIFLVFKRYYNLSRIHTISIKLKFQNEFKFDQMEMKYYFMKKHLYEYFYEILLHENE